MKILYTATVLSHICQFHLPHLQMLQAQGHEIHVAAHDNLSEKNGLQLQYCDKFIETPFCRSPLSRGNWKAYRQLRALLAKEHYDVILCNTPSGGVVTRLAARKTRKNGTKVIYMAHGFHFCKGSSKKSWLLYYPIEKLLAPLCDVLVTINEEDAALAGEKFRPGRVEHIHGVGVRTDRYHPASAEERTALRSQEGLAPEDFVILCTGELNENKDQATLLSAAAMLRRSIPHLRILLAGNGPKEAELKAQIARDKLEEAVTLLGYRTDLQKVVPAADLVVSCSHREGLPLNIVEAMLCEKPVVATHNRGHDELIREGVNGYLVAAGDAGDMAEKIARVYVDVAAARQMGAHGYSIAQTYTVDSVKKEMEQIFASV